MALRARPLVLCYHAASAAWRHPLSTPPDEIERQVAWLLGRGYRPGTAADALAGRGKVLHVTFDDAMVSVAGVLPALERLGVWTTVFVCSGLAGDGRVFDVPELAAEAAAHPGELRTLDWQALREIAERGHEIGSHTVSHHHLPRLSEEDVGRELSLSRRRIEDEIGSPCRFLAYPYGEQDERVRRAARTAGYEGAFGLPGDRSFRDPFQLPRLGIWRGDSRAKIRLKASLLGHAVSVWRHGRV